MASSDTVINRAQAGGQQERGARLATAAGTAIRWSAWLVGLFVVVLLAVGAWLLLGSAEPPARVYSPSEQAQLDAEGRYRGLAADARAAAAADPALAERLSAIASDLEEQAAAVSLPRSPSRAPAGADAPTDPPPPASAAAAPAPSPTAAPADPVSLLAMLRDSSLRSLSDAVDAEPGPARVLASAGANQWRQAVLLGGVLGVGTELPAAEALTAEDLDPEQGASADPARSGTPASVPATSEGAASEGAASEGAASGDGASGDGASGPTTAGPATPEECAGTPLGPDADRQALLGATRAEEQARYGYEVAAALLPDPAPALALSATHRAAADTAAERLAALCEPAAPAPAGHAVGPAFRADPAAALRDLEQDHTEFYAGLVATVSTAERAWAVTSLNAAVQRSTEAGAPLAPLPGLQAEAAGTTGDPTPDAPGAPGAPSAPGGTPAPGGPTDG
ncbi:DUF4439 domain-containing protein [Arthrobacter agilis]|uniref:DUF4439 domain-containing protein n=1 Tax=Arthrobacter agilis TaxID=37921 RepID=UPI001ABEFAFF|nr:DUF4439 domain-containing protein [Arthrobacter agilis]